MIYLIDQVELNEVLGSLPIKSINMIHFYVQEDLLLEPKQTGIPDFDSE